MPLTHDILREMANKGEIEITQRGVVLDVSSSNGEDEKIRGPYRIRLPRK